MATCTAECFDSWYQLDSVTISDLAAICGDLAARVCDGRLLVLFDSELQRREFERRCATHKHLSVRKITRLQEPAPATS